MPIYLYHYYEYRNGPFRSLSNLPMEEAEAVLDELRQSGKVFAGKRAADYLQVRRQLERKARELFVRKGGKPQLEFPHYLTLDECDWIRSWYEDGRAIRIDLEHLDPATISFTYGDLFPTMRYMDGKPYRGQVYSKKEILALIESLGLPQQWNKDGDKGPERYIEAQLWDDAAIKAYHK
jgi:hypothetical protein